MKAQIKIASLMLIAGMFASAGHAESAPTKTATPIDFNRMINDNNNQRTELRKEIEVKAAKLGELTEADKERGKVVDFVDVEVGVGQAAPVVDRRFNSVGETVLY